MSFHRCLFPLTRVWSPAVSSSSYITNFLDNKGQIGCALYTPSVAALRGGNTIIYRRDKTMMSLLCLCPSLGITILAMQNNHERSKMSLSYLPSNIMMQRRMAIRAPVLRPVGWTKASALQDSIFPRWSQAHTRIVTVSVLLWMG